MDRNEAARLLLTVNKSQPIDRLKAAHRLKYPTYAERVTDAVERIAECPTSDAQGIIEAWALKGYGQRIGASIVDACEWAMNDAEEAGVSPDALAREILNP